MPLKGGQVRGALRMLAASAARTAQVVPACPLCPQEKGAIQREQKNQPRFLCKVFDDTTTFSWGGRCVLSHARTRPHMQPLTSLSITDPLHTLPLTMLLPPCRVSRCWSATSNILEQIYHNRAQRAGEQGARGEGGCSVRCHWWRDLSIASKRA